MNSTEDGVRELNATDWERMLGLRLMGWQRELLAEYKSTNNKPQLGRKIAFASKVKSWRNLINRALRRSNCPYRVVVVNPDRPPHDQLFKVVILE